MDNSDDWKNKHKIYKKIREVKHVKLHWNSWQWKEKKLLYKSSKQDGCYLVLLKV